MSISKKKFNSISEAIYNIENKTELFEQIKLILNYNKEEKYKRENNNYQKYSKKYIEKNKDKINKCKAIDSITGERYCKTRSNPKYDGYCTHCFANLFPLDTRTPMIRQKTKEIAVRNFINENFAEFYHDKPLWISGCDCTHRRRIDHRRLINGTLVCVGTDEFQHKPYDKYDEMIRYDEAFKCLMIHGGKFIYIRYNPDPYKENGIKMDPPIEERLEALKKEIEKQIMRVENDENTELLEIIPMYYDR